MQPKISIITITYNSAKTVEETIQSVVSQKYSNLEYIIIDGVSKDNTLEIVNKYKDKIAIIQSEPDNGISDAFNKGIQRATGEIIGIINSDDVLLPGALLSIAANYEKGVDVYRGNVVIWDDIKNTKLSTRPTMSFKVGTPIKTVAHQGTFVTKDAYQKYGAFRTDFRYMMDADLLYRLSAHGAVFKYIDFDMALSRLGGVTSDDWKKKIPEKRKLIRVNGGNKWMEMKSIFEFVSRNVIKRIGFFVFGENISRKIRYK